MTPAERARQIEQEEIEAERQAVRHRAQRYAEQCRRKERARIEAWLGRPAPERIKSSNPKQPKLYTHEGQTKTLSEWSIIAGVSIRTLSNRINSGMDFGRAITMAPRERAQFHTVNGESKTLRQWADHIGISYAALIQRLHQGRTLEQALVMPKGSGRRPGVVMNFAPFEGTGAGSTAQESPNITFKEQAENT